MSALSPYAVEFVQGKAYAGKLSKPEQQRMITATLSETLEKMRISGSKQPRPRAGQPYDASLESILIETALSRIPKPPTVSRSVPSNMESKRQTRKNKFIRPSDANKKLSKLKKSVVNFKVQKQAADAEVLAESSNESQAKADDSSNDSEANPGAGSEDPLKTDSESDSSTQEGRSKDKSVSIRSDKNSTDEASANEANETPPSASSMAVQQLSNQTKQPLKRTPTMDRLKANLQGELLKEVEKLATELINGLKLFQNRLYHKDEIKARVRQRMYYGLKESIKVLQVRKVKMIIMARDLEAGPGGLDELIETLLSKAKIYQVPVVIALSRKKLKRLSQKPSKVACIAITDPSGREEQFERIVQIVKPVGILEYVDEAAATAEAEELYLKSREALESWTSTTRRGRFEFAVDQLFTS